MPPAHKDYIICSPLLRQRDQQWTFPIVGVGVGVGVGEIEVLHRKDSRTAPLGTVRDKPAREKAPH